MPRNNRDHAGDFKYFAFNSNYISKTSGRRPHNMQSVPLSNVAVEGLRLMFFTEDCQMDESLRPPIEITLLSWMSFVHTAPRCAPV